MATIKFYIPTSEVTNFKKFMAKAMKRTEGVSYSLSEPYQRSFIHHDLVDGGTTRKMHDIVDVTVEVAFDNKWQLLAFYKDDYEFIIDFFKPLEKKNPEHGKRYRKCDACGHWLKNSYLILNTETGEELQVGSECLKSYGIEMFKKLHSFTVELYRTYKADMDFEKEDWLSPIKDYSAKQSILATDLIKAAKVYYDGHKSWTPKKNDEYGSSIAIERLLFMDSHLLSKVSEEYVDNVKAFGCELVANTEFQEDMVSVAKNYYVTAQYAAAAFFLIKSYEIYLSQINLPKIEEGMQVYVTGTLTSHKVVEGYNGFYEANEMQTTKGYMVIRYGRINYDNETKELQPFYALVKRVTDRGIILDRACKNAKKGIQIVEL